MNAPMMRFKEFEGDWESYFIGDLIKHFKLGGNYENSEVKTDFPLIKMGNLDRGNIKLDKVEYVSCEPNPDDLIKNGDLFFNTRNTLDLVGKVAIWRGELSVAYFNSNLMRIEFEDNQFMNYALNTENFIGKLRSIATGTTSVAAIYNKDFFKLKIQIPKISEQKKIASFLSAVDQKISLLSKKHELLVQYKKGAMQKIFSQEIRFKDKGGKDFPIWEKGVLGDIFEYRNGKSFEGEVNEYGNFSLITLNSIDISGKLKPSHKLVPQSDGSLLKGDLIMVLSDVAHGNFLGLTAVIPDNTYVLNQRMAGLRKKSDIDVYFWSYYINKNQKYFKLHGQGSSQLNLSKSSVTDFPILTPSLEEQQKIASFLSAVEQKITLLTKELELTKQYKQGLLQQMFI